jgi:tetratricopeptide (TPR) repeat protein
MNNVKIGAIFSVIFVVVIALGYVAYMALPGKVEFEDIPNGMSQTKTDTSPSSLFTDAFNRNDFSAALNVIEGLLLKNQKDIDALLMKATLLAQQASLTFREKELGDQALVYVDQALAIDANSTQALTLKGYIYEIQQDYPSAYKYFDQALAIDAKYAPALAQKGHAKQLQGNNTDAKKLYSEALKIDGNNILALMGMGKIYISEQKYTDAKNSYLKVITLEANARQKAESYYTIGLIAEFENPKDLAAKSDYAQKSIAADSSYAQAYVLLGRTLFESTFTKIDSATALKNRNDSFKYLEKATELYKDLSIAHLQLATQFSAEKDVKTARIILSGLPAIISRDITLDKNQKSALSEIVKNFKSTI